MPKICIEKYSELNEELYKDYFSQFSFPLSDFQKYSIEAIINGHHTLICVPTGSGKTLPAEFAINFFTNIGKRVIYTSPIKALSNQKFYDFSNQYPNISFGLITGDIKINPEAQVIIMTAEILYNATFKNSSYNFLENCACIIHDEIHMINNKERGHIWEGILMKTSHDIQHVMLSATLDHPEKFASWIEQQCPDNNKQVYLTCLTERVVPLIHKSFITVTQSLFKQLKDKDLEREIKTIIDKPTTIQSSKGVFDEIYYHKMKKVLNYIDKNKVFMKRAFVLNKVCKYMIDNELLPCVCFILSRKQLEIAAREITIPLLEDDSKIPYTVKRECEQILRNKIPNYQEYLELPEYISMISLLEKGIATHHSGTLPIIKEMVELLFSKGYIKLLFATETFSCGLNMPIKTVIFTETHKFDGIENRMLYGYEYTQMAGRSGRRGIDNLGTVIHLNNLFKNENLTEYRLMMQGKPQTLVSKFKFTYNLIFNTIDNNILEFINKSMYQIEINEELSSCIIEIEKQQKSLEIMESNINKLNTPLEVSNRYIKCLEERKTSINKKRKELDKEIQCIQDTYKMIDIDIKLIICYNTKQCELIQLNLNKEKINGYINNKIEIIFDFLIDNGFVSNNDTKKLTVCGKISSQIREAPCLVIGKLFENNSFMELNAIDLCCLLSCFVGFNITNNNYENSNLILKNILKQAENLCIKYENFEINNYMDTGTNYEYNINYIPYIIKWYNASNSQECTNVLVELKEKENVFIGEFVKGIIKINNITNELEVIAEQNGDISLLNKFKDIHLNTLKFVATNQSLYI